MDTTKINRANVKMVAHRGLSGIERENTCPAFIAAANRSYYGIETDVHVTADGEFVIIHDDSTNRVSGERINLNVEKVSYSELSEIVLPDKDGSLHRTDIRIPKLSEYVSICKKYGKVCVLELKNRFDPEDIERLITAIDELGYSDGVIYISFSFENCLELRKLLPEASIQWLTGEEITPEVIDRLVSCKLDLDVYYKELTPDIVRSLHDAGIKINCWTCDSKTDAERLVEMGVDFITSNILE